MENIAVVALMPKRQHQYGCQAKPDDFKDDETAISDPDRDVINPAMVINASAISLQAEF
jgi:hypothetical protein